MRLKLTCHHSAVLLFVRLLMGLASIMSMSSNCWAQLDSTGLTGTVTDSTGGVIPAVQVVAVQDATGLRRETVSSDQGTYEITDLPVGVYTVSFGEKGFGALRFENVNSKPGANQNPECDSERGGSRSTDRSSSQSAIAGSDGRHLGHEY